ncbi:hypothetical protein [Nocardioides jishulii]|uniref:Uncharacterized protein n=1 Tax=Nocardioides jishulii TaxID=2575440 RepID=A0A4U2YNY7_9ACTN|nr:hypothetical protein [Nocardioides jishulii]QCX27555.1 hypothetical protein FCL41_08495 [Nocardioides jishulii]TKI62362.1 hypothetical protein FC770_08160 [Nocardioides jishulii]
MTSALLHLVESDPFDLPEWLGESEVVWRPDRGLRTGHLVPGHLSSTGTHADAALPCDLLAVDEAYPVPVTTPDLRVRAHQVWKYGQVLLTTHDDRLTLAVPGTEFSADLALECLDRFALAVGASPERYSALLRIGQRPRRSGRVSG